MEEVTMAEIPALKERINGYILRKDVVVNETYTLEDIVIVGLRTLDREKKWQEKHGTSAKNAEINALKAELAKLRGEQEEA